MKISRPKISKQIFEHIEKMIKNEKLQKGDKLPTEAELTEMFSVSRTPIREALSVLEASGLIKSTQGGGNIVQETSAINLLEMPILENIDIDQVLQLMEVRIILETEAASLSARRRTKEDLVAIEKSFYEIEEGIKNNKGIGHEEDIAFHNAIINATHNPILQKTMSGISNLYYNSVKYSLKKNIGFYEKRMQVLQEHKEIYEHIKNQEPKKAQNAMVLHLHSAQQKLEKYKKNQEKYKKNQEKAVD